MIFSLHTYSGYKDENGHSICLLGGSIEEAGDEIEVLRRTWRICESVKSYILPNPFDSENDSEFFKSLVVSSGNNKTKDILENLSTLFKNVCIFGEKFFFIIFLGNKLKIRVNVEDARQVLLGGKEDMVENALVILKSKYEQLFPKVSQKLKKSLYNFIILGSQIGDFWAEYSF